VYQCKYGLPVSFRAQTDDDGHSHFPVSKEEPQIVKEIVFAHLFNNLGPPEASLPEVVPCLFLLPRRPMQPKSHIAATETPMKHHARHAELYEACLCWMENHAGMFHV